MSEVVAGTWPDFLAGGPEGAEALDRIGIAAVRVVRDGDGLPAGVEVDAAVLDEVRLALPFLPGCELRSGAPPPASGQPEGVATTFTASFRSLPRPTVALTRFGIRLATPPSVLGLWRRTGARWQGVVRDGVPQGVELGLTTGVTVDLASPSVSLVEPALSAFGSDVGAMIGSTGILLHDIADLGIALDDPNPTARGIRLGRASVAYVRDGSAVDGLTVTVTDAAILAGGFSGAVRLEAPPGTAADRLPGLRLGALECRLRSLSATFCQSVPVSSEISLLLRLPFFSDGTSQTWLPVAASLTATGDMTFALGGDGRGERLARITRPGLFDLTVDALALRRDGDVAAVEISGALRPLMPGVTWPTIRVRGLRVDALGRVVVPGGRLRLDEPLRVALAGCGAELHAITIGDERQGDEVWSGFGFSGRVRLADGLAMASFDNLRVAWRPGRPEDVQVRCDAVAVSGRVPGVLHLSGALAFRRDQFAGGLDLTIEALRGLRLLADFVVGREPGFAYWFFRVGVELPAGVPLGATGLSLYGGRALAGQNWAVRRAEDETWFDGWYLRDPKGLGFDTPEAVLQKWGPTPDTVMLGAGVTVGTAADDGFVLTAEMLLVVSIPGPVIFLEGRATALRRRGPFPADPPFRAVVILDLERRELTVGLDVRMTLASVVEVTGSAEGFFSFSDPAAWHLYIGRDTPEAKRISARILSLFRADLYLMLDPRTLRQGATVQYGGRWNFGPVELALRVRLEERVDIFWQPLQLAGFLGLEGEVRLTVFGVGLGLSVAAQLEAQAPAPLEVAGRLRVRVTLPWPLPEVPAEVEFRWREEAVRDPWVDPLAGIELIETTTGRAFEPLTGTHTADDVPEALAAEPPVPLDARPVVRFGRPVDAAGSVASVPMAARLAEPGSLGQRGEELPGVPGRFVSRLAFIEMSRHVGGRWEPIAQSFDPDAPLTGDGDLRRAVWGTWRPLADREGHDAAMQFELFNRYGFDALDDPDDPTRGTQLREYASRICAGPVDAPLQCASWQDQPEGRRFGKSFVHAPGVFTAAHPVIVATVPGGDPARGLTLRGGTRLTVAFAEPAAVVEVHAACVEDLVVTALSGTDVLDSVRLSGDGIASFAPGWRRAVTSLQFDTEGSAPEAPAPAYLPDVVRSPTHVVTAARPDCLRHLEDLLLGLSRSWRSGDRLTEGTQDEPVVIDDRIARRLSAARGAAAKGAVSGKHLEGPIAAFLACTAEEAVAGPLVALLSRVDVPVEDLLAAIGAAGEAAFDRLAGAATDEASVRLARDGLRAVLGTFRLLPSEDPKPPLSLARAVLDARTARIVLQRRRGADDGAVRRVAREPFDAGARTPSSAAVLRRICWVGARDSRTEDVATADRARLAAILARPAGDEVLLEPDTSYRLEVRCVQENAAVSPGSAMWTHQRFFRTAGPPGAFRPGDRLDRLDPYIRSTSPEHGAVEVFRAYGVAFEFSRGHVPGLYAWPAMELRVVLREPDGTPAASRSADGAEQVVPPLDIRWEHSASTSLQAFERLAHEGLGAAPCPGSPAPVPDPRLVAALPSGEALAPRRRYEAVLLGGRTGAARELSRVSFTTGLFRDLEELVLQGRRLGPTIAIDRPVAPVAGTLRAPGTVDRAAEGGPFDAALARVGLAPRGGAIPMLQTLVLRGLDGAGLMLLELPQVLDLGRLTVGLLLLEGAFPGALPAEGHELAAAVGQHPAMIRPALLRARDGTRVLLGLPDGWVTAGEIALLLSYTRTPPEPGRERAPASFVFGAADGEHVAISLRHAEASR